MATKRPRSYVTGNRAQNDSFQGLETSLKQIDNVTKDLDERLDVWEQSRIMPADGNTSLYWPLNEPMGATSYHNEGTRRGSTNSLTPSAQSQSGHVANYDVGAVRLVGGGTAANRTAVGASGEDIGAPRTASISCKIRAGTTAANAFVVGYYTTVPNGIFYLTVNAGGIVTANVRVAGVTTAASASQDSYISVGDWHAAVMTYDGLTLRTYVDGVLVNNTNTAGGAPEWGLAGTKNWYLGSIPVAASGMEGFVRDVRVHNTTRPLAWVQEDWLRFNREWPEP